MKCKYFFLYITNCFSIFLISCSLPSTDPSLLNLALLNTFNIITPGTLISITPNEGQTVTNFEERVVAVFRKPLQQQTYLGVETRNDCTKAETNFLVYQSEPSNCILGTANLSDDRRTLTFQTGTTLATGTYQVRIQNIFDQNSNRVDYQSQAGFTIPASAAGSTQSLTYTGSPFT